jgi:hypothetical protein
MPQNFLTCDREQESLLPPNLRDWLPEDHLAWFVLDAVASMDLDAFFGACRRDGHGRSARPGDDGRVVALRLRPGAALSRGIERRCVEHVAFRVIAANQVAHTSAFAR